MASAIAHETTVAILEQFTLFFVQVILQHGGDISSL
jgi:hypothetical protein